MSTGRRLWSTAFSLLRHGSRRRPLLPRGPYMDPQPRSLTALAFPSSTEHGVPQRRGCDLLVDSRASRLLSYSTEPAGGTASRCWNCGGASPFLACASCGSVQPVNPSVDYFRIFGLEKEYKIRDDNLEGKYKDWQKKLHPDLVHTKSEKERTFAAEQSSRVIDAYRTLSNPLTRALYLLHLEGIHVDEEKTVTDPDLLAEMMDIREAVEEANDSQALKQIQSRTQSKFEDWLKSFQEAFEKQDFNNAITSIHRMRYYDRAIEEIVKKL